MLKSSQHFVRRGTYSHAAARALQSNVGGTPGGVPPLIILPVGRTSCASAGLARLNSTVIRTAAIITASAKMLADKLKPQLSCSCARQAYSGDVLSRGEAEEGKGCCSCDCTPHSPPLRPPYYHYR